MRHTQTFLELQTLETLVLPKRDTPLRFGSRSEMACGLLAEKYIPGFELIEGKTFQVPIGKRQIDFRIRGSFVEYHPIVIEREFASSDCAKRLFEALNQIDDWHKREIYNLIREELRSRYFRKRKEVTEGAYPGSNLILCTNPTEFYEQVIVRFAKEIPSREAFMIEWIKTKVAR